MNRHILAIGGAIAFATMPAPQAPAADLVSEAEAQTIHCLAGKVSPVDAAQCIDAFTARCIDGTEDLSSIAFIARQVACLSAETEAWLRLRTKAVEHWREIASPEFTASVERGVRESDRFAKIKCAVFEDLTMYGQSGQSLGAECYRDEVARMAIFVGYALD